MTFFKTWFFGIIAASLIISILYALIPKGAVLAVAKCAGGVIMLLVVLRPLSVLDPARLKLDYEADKTQIEAESTNYIAENTARLEELITAETEAYICEKAAQKGLVCTAEVVCGIENNVPIPQEVALDIPYHKGLSDLISADLNIDMEAQHWRENE